jgi:hypothetical protein
MAATLEHISHYKGHDILIWNESGIRSFSYGNLEYETIADARSVIDTIGLRRAYLEANEINPEDLEAAADLYDDLMAGDSNLGR